MSEITRHFIQDFQGCSDGTGTPLNILNYTSLQDANFQGRNPKTFYNCNHLLRSGFVEGNDGFKTGTVSSGYGTGCTYTGTAQRGDWRVITVVMGPNDKNGINGKNRFADGLALMEYAFARINETQK